MPTLFLVEDQQLIREGLTALLSLETDIELLGEAENGQAALDWLANRSDDALPDVVLMDIRMPVMDGVAATAAIAQRHPTIKVLVLTTFDDDDLIAKAMTAGAKGYLLKDTPSEELAMSIRAVARGYGQFGPGIVEKMIGKLSPQAAPPTSTAHQTMHRPIELVEPQISSDVAALTPREKEVFDCIGQGASNKEIAQRLYLSEGTVKNHVTSILSQLGLRDRTQVALLAQSIHNQTEMPPG